MQPFVPDNLPLDSIDWLDLIPLMGRATAELSRYDGMLQHIPNPSVLLSPLTTQEATLSSQIEGTQASMEEVLEYEADPQEQVSPSKAADIQEIVNYRRAMAEAVTKLKTRPLCLNLLKELHTTLLDSVRGRNKAPGEFRRIQNFIGLPGCTMEDASFVPPSPDILLQGLDNWEKYIHSDERNPLVHLAVVKAQFEILHPFLDGNGRIGRMLVPLFLYEKKALSSPMFYLSDYFESHRDEYYRWLQAISKDGDWNGWIRFFLTAVEAQAISNVQKTRQITALYDEMKLQIPLMIKSQYAIQTIDALFNSPLFTVVGFARKSGIPAASARRNIALLKENNVILEARSGSGRRGSLYVFRKLLQMLE